MINPRRDSTGTDARIVRNGSWRQPSLFARANVQDPFNLLYQPERQFSHIKFHCAQNVR